MNEVKNWYEFFKDRIDIEKRKAYFLTVKDKRISKYILSRESNLRNANVMLEMFYTRFCSTIVGNNYSRSSKEDLLPICPAWADYPGSRNNLPNTLEKPHFHAIALLHPETVSRLEIDPDGGMPVVKRKLPEWFYLHAKPVIDSKESYCKLQAYAAKYQERVFRLPSHYQDGLFNIFPMSRTER